MEGEEPVGFFKRVAYRWETGTAVVSAGPGEGWASRGKGGETGPCGWTTLMVCIYFVLGPLNNHAASKSIQSEILNNHASHLQRCQGWAISHEAKYSLDS